MQRSSNPVLITMQILARIKTEFEPAGRRSWGQKTSTIFFSCGIYGWWYILSFSTRNVPHHWDLPVAFLVVIYSSTAALSRSI